jgi:CDP-2,3-bis-(O-geranylgeranyl)-sn-glycerol synthase
MEQIGILILKAIWFFLPIGLANMMPVIFKRWFKFLAVPVDFNKKIKGEYIFGPHKTYRGLIIASITGGLIFIIQKHAFAYSDFFHNISLINYGQETVWLGVLFGFGASLGDLIKSFFKRRLRVVPGRTWFPFDQIDYTLGGLVFGSIFFVPPIGIIIGVIFLGACFHILTNQIGFYLGLKESIW